MEYEFGSSDLAFPTVSNYQLNILLLILITALLFLLHKGLFYSALLPVFSLYYGARMLLVTQMSKSEALKFAIPFHFLTPNTQLFTNSCPTSKSRLPSLFRRITRTVS
jgi:hypothetical protein